MSSFLCFVCHSTVNADTNEETREKYREVIGMNLCPDSHLCYICCYFLNKMCMFKSICLKRTLEYPVLFSEKGTINLQRSLTTVSILCPEDLCLQHLNTRYHFYNNNENSQSDFDDNNYYCELQDDRNFDLSETILKSGPIENFHNEDYLFVKDSVVDNLFNEELMIPNIEPVRITQNDLVNGKWMETVSKYDRNRNSTLLELNSRTDFDRIIYPVMSENQNHLPVSSMNHHHQLIEATAEHKPPMCDINIQEKFKQISITHSNVQENLNITAMDIFSHKTEQVMACSMNQNFQNVNMHSMNFTQNPYGHIESNENNIYLNRPSCNVNLQNFNESLKGNGSVTRLNECVINRNQSITEKADSENMIKPLINLNQINDTITKPSECIRNPNYIPISNENIISSTTKNTRHVNEDFINERENDSYDHKHIANGHDVINEHENNTNEHNNFSKEYDYVSKEHDNVSNNSDGETSENTEDTNESESESNEPKTNVSGTIDKSQLEINENQPNELETNENKKFNSENPTDNDTAIKVKQNRTKKKKKKKDLYKKIYLTLEDQKAELDRARKEDKYVTAIFKCHSCAMFFHFKDTYQTHMMRHEESNGEYSCSICSLRFANPDVLRSHKSNHSVRYECRNCFNRVRARQRATHARYCAGERDSYTCHLCGKSFPCAEYFQNHVKRYHGTDSKKSYLCNVCGRSFNSRAKVRTHMITHINLKFKCEKCPAEFRSPYTLNQHNKSKHQTSEPQVHRCTPCNVTFNTRKSLLAHLRNALPHKETVYKCGECLRCCPSESALSAHMAAVHTRTNHLACAHCHKHYSTTKSLMKHMSTNHKEGKPVPLCHSCGITFKSNTVLKRHLKYVCEKDRKCQNVLEDELLQQVPYYE